MIAHDPTRSGSPVPDHAARFSQSEIQAICTKAARGAGLNWGMAEEAGFAARRLSEVGLPGPELLLRYLEGPRGATPRPDGRIWKASEDRSCCPLATGAALSDRARLLDWGDSGSLTIRGIAYPALVLAFVQTISGVQNRAMRIAWRGFEALVGPTGLSYDPASPALGVAEAEMVALGPAAAQPPARLPETGREVALDVWRRLDRLSLLTTVPATDSSRADAGAQASDND